MLLKNFFVIVFHESKYCAVYYVAYFISFVKGFIQVKDAQLPVDLLFRFNSTSSEYVKISQIITSLVTNY